MDYEISVVDVKSKWIDALCDSLEKAEDGSVTLNLITSFAHITGQVSKKFSETDNPAELKFQEIAKKKIDAINDCSESLELVNNSKMFLLKNAKVRPFACPSVCIAYSVLALFLDQIVGFTFESPVVG